MEILPVVHETYNREGILNSLEDIPAAELFEQLFVSLVSFFPIKSNIIFSFSFFVLVMFLRSPCVEEDPLVTLY